MELIQGVVEKILFKDLGEEDQWGNTHRLSIKVGDHWIGFGKKKPNARGDLKVAIKKGAGWEDVEEGDEIGIVATESNGYLNGKTGDIKMVKKASASGTGRPSDSSSPRQATASNAGQNKQNAGGGVDWARKDAGAAASASVDKAIAVLSAAGTINNKEAWSPDLIYDTAVTMHDVVERLANHILNENKPKDSDGGKADSKSGPKPMTNGLSKARGGKPKPVEPDESDFQDDELF